MQKSIGVGVARGLCAAAVVAGMSGAALGGPEVTFPRDPALSPDGSVMVFSWAGDLWAASSDGGVASRLTAHPAEESGAAFSPDGSMLAFESTRGGARNLYVMDVTDLDGRLVAGQPRRVTMSDRSQTLSGFSADGSSLLFSGSQEPSLYRHARMYSVPLDGGPIQRMTDAYGMHPRVDAKGDVFFARGYTIYERPAYRGTGGLDIWRMNSGDGSFDRLTRFDGNDFDAHGLPDGSVVYVSSRSGQNNVHRLRPGMHDGDAAAVTQLTEFAPAPDGLTVGHGVRDFTVSGDGSTAAMVVWDTVYTMDLTSNDSEPVAVSFMASADDGVAETDRIDISRNASEVAWHPSGDAVAVVLRGEIYVRSTEDGLPAQRVTDSHARDRDIAWTPCGRGLYFVRDDEESLGSIHMATVALSRADLEMKSEDEPAEAEEPAAEESAEETDEGGEAAEEPKAEPVDHGKSWAGALRFAVEPVLTGSTHDFGPVPSPDGKKLLFVRGLGDLMLMDVESGSVRTLFEGWNIPEVQWAADSRHIVYEVADLDFNSDIWIQDTMEEEFGATRPAMNVTRHPDLDFAPRLSADGKVLVFLSDRSALNFDFDVYAVFLDKSLEGMSSFEIEKYFEEAAKAARGRKPLAPDAEPVEALSFDAEDAYLRVRRITSIPGSESGLALTPGGDRIIFNATVDGSRGLYSVDPRGGDRKRIAGSAGDVQMDLGGSKIVFLSGGQAATVSPSGGSTKAFGVSASVDIVIAEQQRQKFLEGARRFGESFYHPTLKGLDWEGLTAAYVELAEKTRTSSEFNAVFRLLLGEVNGSHTGIFGGGGGFSGDSARNGYLGIDSEIVENGYRVTRVLDGGPSALGENGLMVGDVIVGVDGQELARGITGAVHDLHMAMAGLSGRETIFEIERDGERRMMLLTPSSYGAESGLRYQQEVLDRRAAVERLSDGRLGYLHIRSMSLPSVRDFERDLYAAAHGKEGLVIDVRDNGGGSTADILLSSLTAPVHAYTIPRGADPEKVQKDVYPRDRRLIYAWTRPVNVLINQNSFSNAEIFAHSIKTIGRGSLIGTETFGGVISTGSFSLIDGTRIRRPFRGWYLPDDRDMEYHGAEPDVKVSQDPADEASGRDRQLEAAVTELLNRIDEGG